MSYFGTDGIRGKFGEYPIHPEFLIKLGFVIGKILLEQTTTINAPIRVVIGKDSRLSGDIIENCLQAGLNTAGVDVYLLGVIPTPAIAHLTQSFQAAAGIVISASHNPFFDNGIKLFSAVGKKISDEMQEQINQQLQQFAQQPLSIDAETLGKSHAIHDAQGRYIEFCKASFPRHLDLTDLTIVLDCANGANSHVAPKVFQELGANVICLAHQPNGININQHCGSTHPEQLQQAVIDYQADVGIAFDGDGDRIVMVNEHGQLIDGDGILYILSTQNDPKPYAVVGTLMSNMGLQLALAQQNIEFYRAKVGDRYVMQTLEKHGLTLGGESSGHILCLNQANTGDAIIAGLQVLAIMVKHKSSLSKLTKDYQQLPQKLVNVRLTNQQDPYQHPTLAAEFAKAEQQLQGRGRLLIRPSGTEPLIRVMVESDDEIECDLLANQLAELIKTTME